ncbi:MAG: hypothetical protein HYS98_07955 [Deltaproteobacteria bacterium]|nr:hypothetical protein [Deltaproteobacteria bacterium]
MSACRLTGRSRRLGVTHDRTPQPFLKQYLELTDQILKNNPDTSWLCSHILSRHKTISNLPNLLKNKIATAYGVGPCAERKRSTELLAKGTLRKPRLNINEWMCKILHHSGWIGSMTYRCGLSILRKSISTFYLKKKFVQLQKKQNLPLYVISSIISEHSFLNQKYHDAYFPGLSSHLEQQFQVLNFVKVDTFYRKNIHSMATNTQNYIFPIEFFLSYQDIVQSFLKLLFHKRIQGRFFFNDHDVSDLIRQEVSRTYNGHIPYEQYLFFPSVKNLCRKLNIHTFLTTYEVMPRERMSIKALRLFSPKTRILGYQHSVISQASASVYASPYEVACNCTPDRIVTTGPEPKNIMTRYGYYPTERIQIGGALRFQNLYQNKEFFNKTTTKNVLILLQDAPHMELLLSCLAHQGLEQKGYRYFLRPNPAFVHNIHQKKLLVRYHKPPFHISSAKSLNENLRSADAVIYWETGAALEALWFGKPVIHFDFRDALSFDPLFHCPHLKWTMNSDTKLIDLLKNIEHMDVTLFHQQQQLAREYVQSYFSKPTQETLLSLIH